MPINLDTFTHLANSTIFGSRDLVVQEAKTPQDAKLGHIFKSAGTEVNDATMQAFKKALEERYGVFGTHAFDYVVGTRAQLHKSLRVCDIKKAISSLETIKYNRFINELSRQLDTTPAFQSLDKTVKLTLRKSLKASFATSPAELAGCTTQEDISTLVANIIEKAIESKKAKVGGTLQQSTFGARMELEPSFAANEPTGLSLLSKSSLMFKGWMTSVEDRVKNGALGAGMRINRSSTNPVLLEKLKTNGVEPGFIFKNDWSLDDTRGLMADIHSANAKTQLLALVSKLPSLAEAKRKGASMLELGMLAGRAHPAGMAYVAEYMLRRDIGNENTPIGKAFKAKFPDMAKDDIFPPDNSELNDTQKANLAKVKSALFVQIRDATMSVKAGSPDYDKSPIFKHFSDRNIAKLDYNEGDKRMSLHSASGGHFRLPERVGIKGGAVKGFFYRNFRLTTADSASAGAVSEALANDITRVLGVPAQELSIVRVQYSDGHPKLMLAAKFADGYKDLEDGYLRDGHLVSPDGTPLEALGKYKALFLALADRDAIGSHGQNKGMIGGQFFAIDPGHSLEGNGKDLEIKDNLSFTDKKSGGVTKRFTNFSVFDDDTRFAKLQGVLKLRDLERTGSLKSLFESYKNEFDPNARGIDYTERQLRQKITDNINRMEREFHENANRILDVCKPQLALYYALAANGPALQEKAIETIENLEKLTSPTTWQSPNGEVKLKHLSVIEETRIPWSAKLDGGNLVYSSSKPVDAKGLERLTQFAQSAGVKLEFDGDRPLLKIPLAGAEKALDSFSEINVIRATHLEEGKERVALALDARTIIDRINL